MSKGPWKKPRDSFFSAISAAVLSWWVQITLKPSAKGLRMHRIFVGGKGRKYVIADSALKAVQVHA